MLQSQLSTCEQFTQPKSWTAKLPFEINQGNYTVKVADNIFEFQQVLELRRQVFLGEFASEDFSDESDYEPIDLDADFIIVLEKNSIVACYRLIYSEFSDMFYSEQEFNLNGFLQDNPYSLELSRACVKSGSRTGVAIHMLWRGIAAYMLKSGAQRLFGCSSVQTLNLDFITKIYRFLQDQTLLSDEYNIQPKSHFQLINKESLIRETNVTRKSVDPRDIPSLFLSYLKAGAKVHGIPAVDLRFGCVDFFTILNYSDLAGSYLRKYIGQKQL